MISTDSEKHVHILTSIHLVIHNVLNSIINLRCRPRNTEVCFNTNKIRNNTDDGFKSNN